MGVIHKLTDEVVNFIIETKKANPKMGCRKMADLVLDKFQTKVSKSSVNNIFKEHSLSSSVGRPSEEQKSRSGKFSIPKERKNELFQGVYEEKPSVREQTKEEVSIVAKDKRLRADPVDKEGDKKDDPSLDLLFKEVEKKRKEMEVKKSALFPHLGFILLQAAQAEMDLVKMFADQLKNHLNERMPEQFYEIIQAICFLRFLGIENANDIDQEKTKVVWALLSEDIKEDTIAFWEKVSTWKMPKGFDVIFLNELQQRSAKINAFKFTLADKTSFHLDAHFFAVGDNGYQRSRPLQSALDFLSKEVIGNNQITIINRALAKGEFDEQAQAFLKTYENCKGANIEKVELIDANEEKITEFTIIPAQRRRFILGLQPDQAAFKDITKSIRWAGLKPLYEPWSDKQLFFAETTTNYFESTLGEGSSQMRGVILWEKKDEEPVFALLTNDDQLSSEEIIREYILRWPDVLNSADEFIEKSNKNNTQEVDNTYYSDLITDGYLGCFDILNHEALKFITQVATAEPLTKRAATLLESICYELNGQKVESDGFLKIFFVLPPNFSSKKELNMAINHVNQANIHDLSGRRVLIEPQK